MFQGLYSRRQVLAGTSAIALVGLGACRGNGEKEPSTRGTSEAGGTGRGTPAPSETGATTPRAEDGAAAAYFPPASGDWERADPKKTGWSPAGLAAAVDVAERSNSATFMMLAGGRILVEEYFLGATASTRLDIFSAQKSITSTLVGLARDRRLLQLDDAVSKYLAKGWSRAAPADEAKITLRHLMTHSSGLNPRTLTKDKEPGREFNYNNDAYHKLHPVLEKAAGTDLNSLSRSWLFDTLSIAGTWTSRPDSTDATGVPLLGLPLTAREMASYGLIAMRRGAWAGKQLTAEGWFAEAWTSSAVKVDYGLLWWLQGKGRMGKAGAPGDLVSALGAADQKIYVIPSLDLVATRQGRAAKEETLAESDFDAVLLKAIIGART